MYHSDLDYRMFMGYFTLLLLKGVAKNKGQLARMVLLTCIVYPRQGHKCRPPMDKSE